MKLTLDRKADAAYIQLGNDSSGRVDRTHPCDPLAVGGQINLDFDAEGRLVGIEVLDASKKLPVELLRKHGF